MKKDALMLAARFSFMPNYLRYCGPEDINSILYNYVLGKEKKAKAEQFLSKFEALIPYLELIAAKNKKDKWDYDVIEAYWLGNKLLDKVNAKDIRQMIMGEFTKKGLPTSTAKQLAASVPEDATPHHSFHCLHIHTITGKIAPTLQNADKCRISVGEVKKIMKDKLLVSTIPIMLGKTIGFGDMVEKEVEYKKEFLPGLKTGNKVALHWDFATHLLSEEEAAALEEYTKKNVEALSLI